MKKLILALAFLLAFSPTTEAGRTVVGVYCGPCNCTICPVCEDGEPAPNCLTQESAKPKRKKQQELPIEAGYILMLAVLLVWRIRTH